jgi:hypothetical protein
METIQIQYIFSLPDQSQEVFDLRIDARKLQLILNDEGELPHWTRLTFNQCPNCPLKPESYPFCPLAVNLVRIVERFDRLLSYEKIHVDVITQERKISIDTSVQQGISSLMGLVIALSACPLTDFFKPMARFHLPFANEEETIWRAASTYLLGQYFLKKDDVDIDIDIRFEGLADIYENIEKMNISILKRLRAISQKDASINALIHLDVFAKYLNPGIEESLNQVRDIIAPFLKK